MAAQGLTNFTEQGFLNYLFGAQAFPSPGTLHFGLHVGGTAPNIETGDLIVEPPTANGYARSAIANTVANFPAATQNANDEAQKVNGGIIPFPTATGDWGHATHWFVADQPTGGNVIAIGIIDVPKDILTNDTASFAAGNIIITLN